MTLKFNGIADAYLEWAVHTNFEGFADAASASNPPRAGLIASRKTSEGAVNKITLNDWLSAPVYDDELHAFVAGSLPISMLTDNNADAELGRWFDHIELASAVCEPVHSYGVPPLQTASRQWAVNSKVVIGCIDDVFPIANPGYFIAESTRLLRLWDQGRQPGSGWEALGNPMLGLRATNFGYGEELVNPANLTSTGSVTLAFTKRPTSAATLPTWHDARNDNAYYERMGMHLLRHHTTHGAAVLDALAGPRSVEDRLSRKETAVPDEASSAPLVLVQLPEAAIGDPSGRWLGRHVLDGIHYILQSADRAKTVVINLSWGPQTGPHDGTSLLELAMNELVQKWRAVGRELHIVLPAGNSYQLRAHAQFEAAKGCQDLTWVVPPDRRTASFLEVWWPGLTTAADVTVTAPDGTSLHMAAPGVDSHSDSNGVVRWGITHVQRAGRTMALIAVQPQSRLHGQWKISVEKIDGAAGDVHIYVARSAPNMGASHHDRPSYLLDTNYEEAIRRSDGLTIADDISPMKDSLVKRKGTLSGIATGDGVFVAGASRRSDGMAAPYTSSGLGKGSGRQAPDYAPWGDESKGLPGVLVGAVRAGSVVRLQGTSIAAPQLARRLVNAAGKSTVVVQLPPPDPRIGNGWPPHFP